MKAVNQTISYGESQFEGSWANSGLLFDKRGDAVENFDYFYIKARIAGTEPLPKDMTGIFGLARPDAKIMLNRAATPKSDKPRLIERLITTADETKTFATRFASDHFSWIDFGNHTKESNETSFEHPLRVNDDFFWSLSTSAVRFGENDKDAWAFNTTNDQV